MFKFLHEQYFPRVIFGPVYLSGHKTVIMGDNLELLGFQGTPEGLRPSLKHREKIINWPTPTNRAELCRCVPMAQPVPKDLYSR